MFEISKLNTASLLSSLAGVHNVSITILKASALHIAKGTEKLETCLTG